MGPAIAALAAEAAGLGAAFYWTLTYALYGVMRIYNHNNAFQYEDYAVLSRRVEHADCRAGPRHSRLRRANATTTP
jgi:hypothetical protein